MIGDVLLWMKELQMAHLLQSSAQHICNDLTISGGLGNRKLPLPL